jgi:hypothetical protein
MGLTKRLPAILPLSCAAFLMLVACTGERVKSGYVGTGSMDMDQVTQLLTQQGYTGITGLHKNGQDWVGQAEKDGQPASFDIAPDGTMKTK